MKYGVLLNIWQCLSTTNNCYTKSITTSTSITNPRYPTRVIYNKYVIKQKNLIILPHEENRTCALFHLCCDNNP